MEKEERSATAICLTLVVSFYLIFFGMLLYKEKAENALNQIDQKCSQFVWSFGKH
jgi:hypothetical protein